MQSEICEKVTPSYAEWKCIKWNGEGTKKDLRWKVGNISQAQFQLQFIIINIFMASVPLTLHVPNQKCQTILLVRLLSLSLDFLSWQSFTPLSLHCQQSQLKSPNCASSVSLGRASQHNARSGSKTQLIRLPLSLLLSVSCPLALVVHCSICLRLNGPANPSACKNKMANILPQTEVDNGSGDGDGDGTTTTTTVMSSSSLCATFLQLFPAQQEMFLILMQVSHTAAVFYAHIKSPVLFIFVWFTANCWRISTDLLRVIPCYIFYIIFLSYIGNFTFKSCRDFSHLQYFSLTPIFDQKCSAKM